MTCPQCTGKGVVPRKQRVRLPDHQEEVFVMPADGRVVRPDDHYWTVKKGDRVKTFHIQMVDAPVLELNSQLRSFEVPLGTKICYTEPVG